MFAWHLSMFVMSTPKPIRVAAGARGNLPPKLPTRRGLFFPPAVWFDTFSMFMCGAAKDLSPKILQLASLQSSFRTARGM
jgi:hypothetical protein